ncbi:hypothetical protein LB507_010566 [Fusarium sp. FIESC RH6]|nr:hypothetical protein LB507_010566 [Fusarium sp. FIESC RH6]
MTQQGITNLQSPATSTSESPNGDNEAHDEIGALVAATEETSTVMENNAINSGAGIGWVADEHQSIAMTSSEGLMTTASLPGSIFQINDVGGLAIDRTTVEPALGTSNINWLSDSQYLSMWESQLSIIPDGLGSMPFTFPSGITRSNSYAPGPSTDCGDISETNIAKVAPISDHTPSSVATTSPLHSQAGSIRSSNASKSTDGALYVEGTMARAPFRGKLLGRHMEQRRGSTMTEAASINGAQDLIEDGQMISASVHVSEDLYSTLVLSADEHIENHGLNSTATLIPPLGHIRCFVRLYYENFHDTYPFLRKSASIWQDTGNWLLLLAVSTIGAKYLGGTWSTSMSRLLETILEHKLDVMSRGSNQNSRDTWIPGALKSQPQLDLTTLQAMILNLIHRIHSGQKNLIERALSQRSILAEECRRMRLLSRTPPQIDIGTVNDTSFIAAWLKAQSELRTGLMLWILDSVIAYEFDCQYLLQLHEVQTVLPCQDEMWDQPTLEGMLDYSSRQATVLEALHLLYMKKQQPSNLTEFGNVVMIYAVCQRTKEATYQYQTPLSRWTPVANVEPCPESVTVAESWPPNVDIITRWRNSACDCLDILHWKANGKAANAGGSEHPTILLLHLSRLYILAPCKHLQTVATSAALFRDSNETRDTVEYSEACKHLHLWANVDQYKARLSIVHAGALIWHVRRYSRNGFMEPHAVYLATLLIWAYSVFATPPTDSGFLQNHDGPNSRQNPTNQVPRSSDDAGTPTEYDDEEEPEPKFIHLDRPCDDEIVQTFIRVGHKMQGYMQRVGNICSSGAPSRILKEGVRLLSYTQTKQNAWGIEISFSQSLTSLSDATSSK